MYTRDGYVPLSRLWGYFERKFLPLCKERALVCMEADRYSSGFVFGTALDLCEDVFLRSFDTLGLDLVPLVGEVVQVDPVLMRSGARLLLKMTAFESAQVSLFQDEAGPDRKWLKRMGSSAFCAADFGWLFPDKMGRDTGADLEKILFANVFHTLPVLFERQTFVIAKELPPWSNDLLEESYVRNVWQETRGFSICLSETSAQLWRRSLRPQGLDMILRNLIPHLSAEVYQNNQSAGGRPGKLTEVVRAYEELGLMKANLARKEELRRIEEHLQEKVSQSTLVRARRALRLEGAGNSNKQF
jgi:hypothetical protein